MRLAETNTAALTALALGRQTMATLVPEIDAKTTEIAHLNETLAGKHQQLQDPNLTSDQKSRIEHEMEEPTKLVAQKAEELKRLRQTAEYAKNAIANGTAVATVTDLIAKNQRYLSSREFHKEGSAFSIGGHTFTPHPIPPTADGVTTGSDTTWTGTQLECYNMPTSAVRRPGATAMLPAAHAASVIPAAITRMYLYEFNEQGRITTTVLPLSPFQDIPVSHRQLLGISFNAITTNKTGGLPLTWTATMRDQTSSLGTQKGGKHAGQPIGGAPYNWCEDVRFGNQRRPRRLNLPVDPTPDPTTGVSLPPISMDCLCQPAYAQRGHRGGNRKQVANRKLRKTYLCGGLATEFQIRSPVVANGGFASGAAQVLTTPRLTTLYGRTPQGEQSGVYLEQAGSAAVLPIPNTSNWVIKAFSGPIPIPSTMAPGSSVPTSLCPPVPPNLL